LTKQPFAIVRSTDTLSLQLSQIPNRKRRWNKLTDWKSESATSSKLHFPKRMIKPSREIRDSGWMLCPAMCLARS